MNKLLARRAFLKALGIAPALAKETADLVAKQAAMAAAGIQSTMGPLYGHGAPQSYDDGENEGNFEERKYKQNLNIREIFLSGDIPGFVMRRMRDDASYISHLDPDLVSNRSFSLSTKVNIQRERNLTRSINNRKELAQENIDRYFFKKVRGFNIW
jgi:hypothetical protein